MTNKSGFITKILLIVIALILLKYIFHFDFVEFLKSTQVQKVIGPVTSFLKDIYNWLDGFVRSIVQK